MTRVSEQGSKMARILAERVSVRVARAAGVTGISAQLKGELEL